MLMFCRVLTAVLPELIETFSAVPIKILAVFFEGIDKLILLFLWKYKRLRIIKSSL